MRTLRVPPSKECVLAGAGSTMVCAVAAVNVQDRFIQNRAESRYHANVPRAALCLYLFAEGFSIS